MAKAMHKPWEAVALLVVMACSLRPSAALAQSCCLPEPHDAVGLEAVGMSPLTALRYGATLDVRDALNRPVSSRKIEQQIKESQTRAAIEASYASKLPGIQAALRALEKLLVPLAVLRSGLLHLPHLEWQGLPLNRRSAGRGRAAARRASALAAVVPAAMPASSQLFVFHPPSKRQDILLC